MISHDASSGPDPRPSPSSPAAPVLTLCLEDPARLAGLLQSGFRLALERPLSVAAFLSDRLGLSPAFVAARIQTVFLDGLAVDDMATALVRPGTRLALSGALPGLVGATMRRGGVLASLRQGVTHAPAKGLAPDGPDATGPDAAGLDAEGEGHGPFLAEVRLFNQAGPDLAARVLALGARLPARTIREFLAAQPPAFWTGIPWVRLEGRDLDREALLAALDREEGEVLATLAPEPRKTAR